MNLTQILTSNGEKTSFSDLNKEMHLPFVYSAPSIKGNHQIFHRQAMVGWLGVRKQSTKKANVFVLDPELLETEERAAVYAAHNSGELQDESVDLAYTKIAEGLVSVKWKETGLIMLVGVVK